MSKLSAAKLKAAKEFYAMAKAICPRYNLKAIEAITAQAMNESAWGTSSLSKKYFNYFGMKCSSSYKGASVNMKTKEEYKVGQITTIKSNFRAYANLQAGVIGYCEFILSYSRYKNLLGITDAPTYFSRLKSDGWATDSKYVATCTSVWNTLKENGVFDSAATPSSQLKVGTTYTLSKDSYIWTVPLSTAPTVDLSKFKNCKNNALLAGQKVECTGVATDAKGNVWCKCPLGYIPHIYNGYTFLHI